MRRHVAQLIRHSFRSFGYDIRQLHQPREGFGWLATLTKRYVEHVFQFLFHAIGYHVNRTRWSKQNLESLEDRDSVAAMVVEEAEYYAEWKTPGPIFSPWRGHPDFEKLYAGLEGLTLVSRERCYMLASLAHYAVHLDGAFAECGVYKGGTALLLSRVVKDSDKILYLFDSFEGLPKPNDRHDRFFYEGEFSIVSMDVIRQRLSEFRHIVDIRKGWIPGTFSGLENERYAFVHIDVDLYQSALDCCAYFYPRLVAGGVFVFDEYGFAAARGEKDAVDNFFVDKPEVPITLPTGQAIVIKLPGESATGSADVARWAGQRGPAGV